MIWARLEDLPSGAALPESRSKSVRLRYEKQWFGFSFVMHFLMAVVLGAVVSYGLRLAVTEEHK